MSRMVKIALLPLAAFLFLGFSIAAGAAPPWTGSKPQYIASAPLMSWAYQCAATNHTDVALEIEYDVLDHMGDTVLSNGPGGETPPFTTTLGPGRTFFAAGWTAEADMGLRYCTLRWLGQSGDVRASFCAWQDATDYQLKALARPVWISDSRKRA